MWQASLFSSATKCRALSEDSRANIVRTQFLASSIAAVVLALSASSRICFSSPVVRCQLRGWITILRDLLFRRGRSRIEVEDYVVDDETIEISGLEEAEAETVTTGHTLVARRSRGACFWGGSELCDFSERRRLLWLALLLYGGASGPATYGHPS